jgi:hypothetical protein
MATYEFIIKKQGGGSSKSPVAGDEKSTDTEKGQGLLSKDGAKKFAQGMVAYKTVKSFATQIINHEVSMVELRTGSKELQERANFTNQLVQQGVGILESMVAGAMVGGIVGAVVGTALSVTHTAIGYAQAQNRIDTQRTLENNSIQMNYIRAGARGSRGDT